MKIRALPKMSMALALALVLVLAAAPLHASAAPASSEARVQTREGRGLVIAGVVLVVTSIVGYIGLAAGLGVGNETDARVRALQSPDDLSRRRDLLRRGKIANTAAIVSGVSAAVTMGVGIPLIVVGRRRGAAGEARATLGLGLLPTNTGAALRLRF